MDDWNLAHAQRVGFDEESLRILREGLEGVVTRGTASWAFEDWDHERYPLAGKTGTTNDAKDAWFVGFSPDLAVGVYMGFDTPKSLGTSATAGQYAAPIFRDFMAARTDPDTLAALAEVAPGRPGSGPQDGTGLPTPPTQGAQATAEPALSVLVPSFMLSEIQRAFEIGVQRYLGKPYQELDLMRNVYDLLGIARVRE